ncbi:flagellar basal-body rod protein FlgB [Paenibacillus sp. FSL H8-0548]|uniref:flagellar basal body rod protein FlgB n=1 Tax=Paenibacillus sp. FSL H8-0548 TaxID=1920422 RepID=UPI00096C72F8|nr:flagellar basal body rod protein FlgB [Paenibacillus sp. FSL H8-0548]OMF36814.1 flagellar basal-body rod protein FlgB [Paenibacillus sp. FSL H8-0548]
MNLLNGASFQRMEGALQAAEMRQRVISNNVANNDTPHFKRSEVLFETLLEQTLGNNQGKLNGQRTNEKHISIGSASSKIPIPKLITDETTAMNNNQNNVDIDREMSLLAKNQLSYSVYVQQINHEVRMIRTAIEGRG